jgi:hypothetical protein
MPTTPTPESLPADTLLLPIDLHGINRATLDILVRIAGHLHYRVLGLLVDDPRLAQVAALPFTTEVVLGSGSERALAPAHLQAHFGRVSRATQQLLGELAGRHRVQLSYESATGVALQVVLQRPGAVSVFLPSRARRVLAPEPAAGVRAIPRLGLLLGGGDCDNRVLAVARALAADALVGRVDVIAAGPPEPAGAHVLGHHRHRPRWLHLDCGDPASLLHFIRRARYDLLVLPFACLQGLPPAQLEAALAASPSQVLMVR